LLREAGVTLDADQVAELHQRTEGWPAGLYLAALCLREGGSLGDAVVSFGGDDRFVSEYINSEFLASISSAQRVFLTRTAVLERMCAPLCAAVLGDTVPDDTVPDNTVPDNTVPDNAVPGGPAQAVTLDALAGSNLLLVPLDRRGRWFRYHHLFREMLLGELERREPGLIPELRRRAAAWCARNDLPEEALEYSIAAGDAAQAARLMQKLWLVTYRKGRVATLKRWFGWLNDQGLTEEQPVLAVWAAFIAGQLGRPAETDRWAAVVDRWRSRSPGPRDPQTEGWAALLCAILCRQGIDQMRADADEAARSFAAVGLAVPAVALYRGIAQMLSGDPDGGDAYLEEAVGNGDVGAPDILATALCYRSLIAMARNQWSQAEAFASQTRPLLRAAGTTVSPRP
jgi:LuxR family transcriptional regulator, maltose regulon positive regulatory protein